MSVEIQEVVSKKQLRQFVEFPNRLYRDNPYYVPQLVSADLDSLTPGKNHAFDFCEGKYWLAIRDGKIVGRIAGIINHEYNKQMGKIYIRFGWLDFVDDEEVVNQLIHTMETWAKSKNANFICGPVGFLEFDIAGVLVEGYDQIPTAYGKYNAPYYAGHLERLGYAKEVDWVEYQVKIPDTIPDAVHRVAQVTAERHGLTLLQFDNKKALLAYADKLFALMNRQYACIHGFTQLTPGQVEDLKNQFLPMLNLKFVSIVVDSNDELVGFAICLPSVSKALQKARGHLFPFGFIHILRALRKNDTIDTLLIAVATEYQNKGVTAMMFDRLWQQMHDNGFTTLESTRQLEENLHVRNLWNRFGFQLHKRARSFIKSVEK